MSKKTGRHLWVCVRKLLLCLDCSQLGLVILYIFVFLLLFTMPGGCPLIFAAVIVKPIKNAAANTFVRLLACMREQRV